MLTVDELHVTYGGAVQALRGVSLEVPTARSWPSWAATAPGKTTLLRADLRHPAAAPRPASTPASVELRRHATWPAATPADVVRVGACRCPRGGASSAGSPSRRTCAPAAWAAATRRPRRAAQRPGLRAVPGARRTQRAARRAAVRRRAADAGHRPGADGRARGCCCSTSPPWGSRRSIIGQIGEVIAEINGRARRCCWWSRTPTMALGGRRPRLRPRRRRGVAVRATRRELARTDEVQRLYLGARPRRRRRSRRRTASGRHALAVDRMSAPGAAPVEPRSDPTSRPRRRATSPCGSAAITALADVSLHRRARHHPRAHRAQRRRQVDLLQRPVRRLQGLRGAASASASTGSTSCARTRSPARRRPDLPEHRPARPRSRSPTT